MKAQLKKDGYYVAKGVVSSHWLEKLKKAAVQVFKIHEKFPQHEPGVGLHAIISDSVFIEFLSYLQSINFIESIENEYFQSKCILNSMSVLNTIKNQPNFSAQPHRDLRFYSGTFPIMINCLVMLDDFTVENGATYILPHSHLQQERPTNEYFFENAKQIIGNAGDILVFNSNTFHASAANTTNDTRMALPITLSKSCMKPLLDYPRAIGYDKMETFSTELQQLLGYHSRVPANLEEWYLPENERFYKKGND